MGGYGFEICIALIVLGLFLYLNYGLRRKKKKKGTYTGKKYSGSPGKASARQKAGWVSPEEFQKWKYKMKPFCYEKELDGFMAFLKSYGGGYVRRNRGKIVAQDFLGKEKGDLKGIFFQVVLPNPNISVLKKEEFRNYLISIGVYGLENKPDYEASTELVSGLAEEDQKRKAVGERGEHIVQVILGKLNPRNYLVIHGAVLRYERTTKEFDHIVICREGVFMIETKAFALTDGKTGRAKLLIEEGDRWIVQKHGRDREVKSPTDQIKQQQELLERIIRSCPVAVHPVLALSNTEITLEQNMKLPYHVIRADNLTDFITGMDDRISVSDQMLIQQDIEKAKRN